MGHASRHDGDAGIDFELHAGDEPRFVGHQIGHCVADVEWFDEGVGMALMKLGTRSGRCSPSRVPSDGGIIPVGTPVGCTELTRIFWAASSFASATVKPMTPCLAAV